MTGHCRSLVRQAGWVRAQQLPQHSGPPDGPRRSQLTYLAHAAHATRARGESRAQADGVARGMAAGVVVEVGVDRAAFARAPAKPGRPLLDRAIAIAAGV